LVLVVSLSVFRGVTRQKRKLVFQRIPDREDKMPRNTTGGSGHRSQRNSESNKTKSNNKVVDALLDDIANKQSTDGVFIGRIQRRLGSGRMEVFYTSNETIEHKERVVQAPIRGGMRGRGKKDVWVDVGGLVMIANSGLGNAEWSIIAVLHDDQAARYRKICPTADPRLFVKVASAEDGADDGGVEFIEEEDDEVDVDDI